VEEQRDLIEMLVARLERLSADSYWAHQASGVRGSLLRLIENDSLEKASVSWRRLRGRNNRLGAKTSIYTD